MAGSEAPPALDVVVSSLIRRPVVEVAAHATDPETAPEWQPHVLGRRLPLAYEVVELVPGERMVLRTGQGPFSMETTITWQPVGTWTRMTLRNTGDAPGLGLAAPLLTRALKKAMSHDLARLKNRIEAA